MGGGWVGICGISSETSSKELATKLGLQEVFSFLIQQDVTAVYALNIIVNQCALEMSLINLLFIQVFSTCMTIRRAKVKLQWKTGYFTFLLRMMYFVRKVLGVRSREHQHATPGYLRLMYSKTRSKSELIPLCYHPTFHF